MYLTLSAELRDVQQLIEIDWQISKSANHRRTGIRTSNAALAHHLEAEQDQTSTAIHLVQGQGTIEVAEMDTDLATVRLHREATETGTTTGTSRAQDLPATTEEGAVDTGARLRDARRTTTFRFQRGRGETYQTCRSSFLIRWTGTLSPGLRRLSRGVGCVWMFCCCLRDLVNRR